MKTPTLIIRLIGFWLLFQSVKGYLVVRHDFAQQSRVEAQLESIGMNPSDEPLSEEMGGKIALTIATLLAGILVSWNAGAVARRLTRDSEEVPAPDTPEQGENRS